MTNKRRYIFIIITIGILLYARTLFNGFIWDDEGQIIKNIPVHSVQNAVKFFLGGTFYSGGKDSLEGFYYKPLMTLSFSIIYSLFGPNALFFHLLQILLHIVNALFVFYLLRKFVTEHSSFWGAMIFLVHPIQVEAVAYIAALQDVLFFFFGMCALLISDRKNTLVSYIVLYTLLLCSLLSKETGVAFIIILPLYHYVKKRSNIKTVCIVVAAALLTYLVMRFGIAHVIPSSSWFNPISRLTFGQRLINIPRIVLFYIITFIAPIQLAVARHEVVTHISFLQVILPAFVLIGLTLAIIYFIFRIDRTKTDARSGLLFFGIWAVIGIGIHSQIYPLDMTVAERWFYLPSVAAIFILIKVTHSLHFRPKYTVPIMSIIVLMFAVRTFIRLGDWYDPLTLYRHDTRLSVNSFDLYNNYGGELLKIKRYDEAEYYLTKSIELAPEFWINWNNLGALYLHTDRTDKAIASFKRSILNNGDYSSARQNLGLALLFYQHDWSQARIILSDSVKKFPQNAKLWLFLAISQYYLNDYDQALMSAKHAYQLNPSAQTDYVLRSIASRKEIKLKL